jgi:serine/threonine protein kinase
MTDIDGTRIGKYLVRSRLGAGSSGAVYRALDEFSQVEVAIKVYDANLLGQMPSHVRLQFLTEASLAGQLEHPHIAKILDASTNEDISYVVTEYVPGGSLADLELKGELLPVGDVIEIGFKCCGALDYAFRNGIIHRDIKPANILVAGGTEIKIADFGAAWIRNADRKQLLDVGSPAYLSPEQAQGNELTHKSDMFALGVVLYELCTGERPFSGSNVVEVISQIVAKRPRVPSKLRADLPAGLDEIFMRALRKNPARRFDSWVDFALALADVGRLSAYEKNIPDSEKFTVLKERPLLANLGDADIWELASAGHWSRVPSRTQVLSEGEAGDSLFLLADGEAKVTMKGRLLNVIGDGEWFGEIPYIIGKAGARGATVETSADSTLVEFPRSAIESLGDHCQLQFAKALMRNLSDRLAFSNVRVLRMGDESE